ncbi:uncharacterized protein LOC129874553 [Solanum dulcamara]|uniref:uncharacterized protein LOC129874553 n=1 Tax=Solanum dulcamara TaxID=45834 RepID=UPI0024858826|nr:uncharacterized protein LOC129874553 [Solanum dulcamara]
MASSSIVLFPAMIMSCSKFRIPQKLPKIRAQSYRDEGKSSKHVVDANLQVLKERIEEVKMKERLEKCLVCEQGWNYTPTNAKLYYDKKHKKQMDEFVELFWMVGGTIGFTILGCTLCLYLTSLLIRLNH